MGRAGNVNGPNANITFATRRDHGDGESTVRSFVDPIVATKLLVESEADSSDWKIYRNIRCKF